ncbi:hypothetical protein HHK36_014586 [Tetracentron sinense]|uniref:Uncharacterized protein n=1 Tax=Tetracentron sinense TaxID=13715 RepID=A0A835DCU3_TETSI|nr:hypothetical protein HHK36_014586 [Tetracentron sinense]
MDVSRQPLDAASPLFSSSHSSSPILGRSTLNSEAPSSPPPPSVAMSSPNLIMILDFKLIYPSGTATAHLINNFHTPQGAKLPKLDFNLSTTSIIINSGRDFVGNILSWLLPLLMAMVIPFFLGSYFAIDICVESFILFVLEKMNKAKVAAFGLIVAFGLVYRDGIWTFPSSIFVLAGVNPPISMKF